jgi:Bacterial regulatory proteins, luxR family
MALAAEGSSNEQIAAKLYLSTHTMRTQILPAMMKLHASDRAQLVVIAYQTGLVRPAPPAMTRHCRPRPAPLMLAASDPAPLSRQRRRAAAESGGRSSCSKASSWITTGQKDLSTLGTSRYSSCRRHVCGTRTAWLVT